jgi:hypothetical protein
MLSSGPNGRSPINMWNAAWDDENGINQSEFTVSLELSMSFALRLLCAGHFCQQ